MAITPQVSGEQGAKLTIRANTGGGANVWWNNPAIVRLVNGADAANTNTKLFQLVVSGSASTNFTISGSNITVTGINGNTTVSGFATALAAALPSGQSLIIWAKGADYLKNTTTDFIISAASGTTITNLAVSGTGTSVAGINKVTISTTSGAYPNYYGTPNAVPTWVDDATVHTYQLDGAGAVTVNSGIVVQTQVRQIQTSYSETQIMDGYFAAYQSNLNQTQQKNTKQQQC